jgi:hypothetical protein
MFEAVSNGLHAIDDRFWDKARDNGRIEIEVLRGHQPTAFSVRAILSQSRKSWTGNK